MLSRVAKILLVLTSVAPAVLTYAVAAVFMSEITIALKLLAAVIILVLSCITILRHARHNLEKMNLRATSVEVGDQESIGLLLVYLLPLLRPQFEFAEINLWICLIFLLVFALFLSVSYGYHFNPLLGFLGWHFYKIKTQEGVTYVLITKKRLRSVMETIKIGQLTEYILIDLEKET